MSDVVGQLERRSAVALARGLYVIRYTAAGSVKDFPLALVAAALGSEPQIDIISAPGDPDGRLDRPGAFLVVRAKDAAQLEIAVRRTEPAGSLDATFQIDTLSNVKSEEKLAVFPVAASLAQRSLPPPTSNGADQAITFAVAGHVAMRGDVAVAENEWMAGPASPAPIEALRVRSSNRARLAVEIQVLLVGAPQWSVWIEDGGYAGTRGRGLALAGVRLRLVGAEALLSEIAADALFLGAMVQSKAGRQIEFTSSTGSEPLVGIKMIVRRAERASIDQSSEAAWQDRGSRVRVFRSSPGK